MDLITIDIETATLPQGRPCEIGLAFVSGGQIIGTKNWLIKPMFNELSYFNNLIDGTTPEHFADKPEFDELQYDDFKLI